MLRRGRAQDRLDIACDDYPYETSWSLQSLTTGANLGESGFDEALTRLNEVTKFGYLSSHSVGLVPSNENQLVIHDSIAGGMDTETGPPPFTQLRIIITCSLRQATVSPPGLRQRVCKLQNVSCIISQMTFASQTQTRRQSYRARAACP
jgi:hypothetical protein